MPSSGSRTPQVTDSHHDDHHDDHGGLQRDLAATDAVMDRRRALRFAAALGVSLGVPALGCRSSAASVLATATENTTGTSGTSNATCSRIPEETAGPYPGEGSNGPNVLNLSGVARQDIRSSFAGLSGTATGVPLTIALTIVSASTCTPLSGRAVYLWHCDAVGRYSLYSSGVTDQNYLRGVQAADTSGVVTFTSIFPGCYAGRWPHIHFEVYPSLTAATNVANKSATSQIALPKATCDAVYATSAYTGSATNLAGISLATDNVFSDGSALELATITGSISTGLTASLTIAI